ncbi:MAG: SCO family protein [Gammaproteobacteria bacterium]|nr:SCO family protein [Gammaproteobacteria bacterium]MCH9763242.1 SCO family protein [Gammaproteobacteria bacterium]
MNILKKKSIGLVALLVALMLAGILTSSFYSKRTVAAKQQAARDAFHGTLLNAPRPVQPFALAGTNGTPFTQNNLKNHWTMMFFGFTRCGFVCPTTMAELGKMYRTLEGDHASPLPQVVMVSIDPARDDLSQLQRYVTAFHPSFQGARGSEEMTRAMTHALGVAYAKTSVNPNAPATEDDIEHTGAVMLFNPDGNLAAFFTTPHQAKNLSEDYQLLLKNS